MLAVDRRAFLAALGATGLAACAKPERDLLEQFDDVDLTLEPADINSLPATTATTGPVGDLSPMGQLRASVPFEDQAGLSFIARAVVPQVAVELRPGDSEPTWTFDNPIESGDDLVFLVDDFDGEDRYRVLLPVRPNGSYGWIQVADVELERHNFRIRVELEEFRLTLFDREAEVFTTPIGVARDNAPTPLGQYFTTELIQPPVPDTIYGAFAYGLSGYSETFTSFNGGAGQLGIHGTSDPASIGTNVSAGCIRMLDADITRMVEEFKVAPGVPVEVI